MVEKANVRCICLCKDTNFKANHNQMDGDLAKLDVVYAYAKILILKQITTRRVPSNKNARCICLCKDTNFKANHNTLNFNNSDFVGQS